MSDVDTSAPAGKRPATVIIVAILVFLGAIAQLLATAGALFLAMRPGEDQRLIGQPVSDWYWIMTALLSFLLFLIYLWIGRGLLAGNQQAWLLVNVLSLINAIFAIFQIPFGTGWASLVIALLLLVLNNTASARMWFRTL